MSDCNIISDMPDETINPSRLTFHKGERLRHRTLVESLFREGDSLYDFPLRLSWRVLTKEELEGSFRGEVPQLMDCLQMMVTVPKKKRRHAVDRVLMRRRIRESYRLNRNGLKDRVEKDESIRVLCLGFVYIHDKNLPYSSIEPKMRRLLGKMNKILAVRDSGQN